MEAHHKTHPMCVTNHSPTISGVTWSSVSGGCVCVEGAEYSFFSVDCLFFCEFFTTNFHIFYSYLWYVGGGLDPKTPWLHLRFQCWKVGMQKKPKIRKWLRGHNAIITIQTLPSIPPRTRWMDMDDPGHAVSLHFRL